APPAGYAPPPQGYGPWTPQQLPPMPAVPTARAAGGSALGIVAFVLGLIAAVGASIVAAVAGFQIGIGTGDQLATQLAPAGADFDFALLSPVREWVLLAEVSFWVGTVLGVWAIVQGIVAIAKNRGRGWGITAVVIAVAGPVIYGVALWGLFATGIASSATPLGA
ncbi:MAG: hypothetical protein ABWY37_02780, partial [Microbacterium pygmaeum]